MKSRLSLGTKIRIVAEMEKDKNKHRVRKLYAAKGIAEGEVSFKGHDEGRTSEGGTPGKHESRATSSGDVYMSGPSGSSGNKKT